MTRKAQTVLGLIGATPIVKLQDLPGGADAAVWAKLEYYNPLGSVKDRICTAMIDAAEANEGLKPGGVIIEPTSGNTGLGLAMVAAVKGYKLLLTMPETMSSERCSLLSALGAEIVLTPGDQGMKGAVERAEELLRETEGAFMPQQFRNPANPEIHRKTTAEEIWAQTGGKIDAFVAGVGTGGTITGVGEVLKSRRTDVKIYAVEPAASSILSGGKPGPHKIQGIGAGFVPEVLNRDIIDEVIQVTDEEAAETTRQLALKEGLVVGISSGAACWAALKVAAELGADKDVVCIFPDTGERYLSTGLYI